MIELKGRIIKYYRIVNLYDIDKIKNPSQILIREGFSTDNPWIIYCNI